MLPQLSSLHTQGLCSGGVPCSMQGRLHCCYKGVEAAVRCHLILCSMLPLSSLHNQGLCLVRDSLQHKAQSKLLPEGTE